MASLTPLSKGLIAIAVVGGMASAVWHLALKERFAQPPNAVVSDPVQGATTMTPEPPPATYAQPDSPVVAQPDPIPAPSAFATDDTSASASADTLTGRSLMQKGDYAQARQYLERAVENGSGAAACHLGEMTLQGQGGIPANQEAAAKLFQLAQSRESICFAPGQ